jgi:hypothetical protein
MLSRLAANGEHAVKIADHIEATIELKHDRDAASAARKPERRQKHRRQG